jgi:hypothetical protein
MLTIGKITCPEDIEECVYLYESRNDRGFLASNFPAALNAINKRLAARSRLGIIRDDGKIVAWILCTNAISEMSGDLQAHQLFYGSSLTGTKAVKSLVMAHDYLIEFARISKAVRCISTCSHEDNTMQLCRILAKHGWKTKSYTAIFEIT